MKRVLSLILALCLVLSIALTSTAATYTYNSGTRHDYNTSLSSQAQAYYTGDYTWEKLSALEAGTEDCLETDYAMFQALHELMSSTLQDLITYKKLTAYWPYTDADSNSGNTCIWFYADSTASGTMSREHVWPKSHASFKESGGGCDLHHLRPSVSTINSARDNLIMGNVKNLSGSYTYSWNGKVVLYKTSTHVEVNDNIKGDVARILLYVWCCWEEPNLFKDTPNPVIGSGDDKNDGGKVIESLDTLLEWCEMDPVDTWEMSRNDQIENIQGNRNVFIDYPEFAWLLFGREIPENMTTPSGIGASGNPTACPHTNTEIRNTEDATCTAAGYTGDTYCLDCQTTISTGSATPHLAHINENGDDKCDRDGCGATVTCGHAETELRYAKDATCTTDGYTGDEVCIYCYYIVVKGSTIDKLGHINKDGDNTCDREGCGSTDVTCGHKNFTEYSGQDATCTEDGWTAYKYCNDCKTYFEPKEVIEATGHTNITGDNKCDTCNADVPCGHGSTTTTDAKEATCTEEGYTAGEYCNYCGYYTVPVTTISKLKHTNTNYDNICDVCGTTVVCGHGKVYMAGYIAPTCTESGVKSSMYCEYCHELRKQGDVIPPTGHTNENGDRYCDTCDWDLGSCDHGKTETRNAVKVTCGTNGYTGDECCVYCDTVITKGKVLYATSDHSNKNSDNLCDVCGTTVVCGHGKTELQGAQEATCSKAGYTGDTVCIYCGVPQEYGTTIRAIGHTNKNNDNVCDTCGANVDCGHKKTELQGKTAATCGKNGYTGDTVCVYCGDVVTPGEIIPATGKHNYGIWVTNGSVDTRTCKNCDYQEQRENTSNSTEPSTPNDCPHADSILRNDKAATCTQDGYTGDQFCGNCGELLLQGSVIPTAGHTNQNGDDVCDVCKADVNCAHGETEWMDAKDATCSENGHTGNEVCVYCGQVVQAGKTIPATGEHRYGQWSGSGDTETRTCQVCGHQEQKQGGSTPTTPSEPAETDPAPSEPAETDPAPSEPAETDPAPSEPAETDPAPSEPAETDPAPSEPAETDPAPSEPVETDPAPSEPVETDPAPSEPTETDPALTDPAAKTPIWPWILIAALGATILVAIILLQKKKR